MAGAPLNWYSIVVLQEVHSKYTNSMIKVDSRSTQPIANVLLDCKFPERGEGKMANPQEVPGKYQQYGKNR